MKNHRANQPTILSEMIIETTFLSSIEDLKRILNTYQKLPTIKAIGYQPCLRISDFEFKLEEMILALEDLLRLSNTWEVEK